MVPTVAFTLSLTLDEAATQGAGYQATLTSSGQQQNLQCQSTMSQRNSIVVTSSDPAPVIFADFSSFAPADRCNLPPTGDGRRVSVGGKVEGDLDNIHLYLLIFPYERRAYSLAYDRACEQAVIVANGNWSTEADLQGPNSLYQLVLIAARVNSSADEFLQTWLEDACGDPPVYTLFVPDTGGTVPRGMGSMPLDDVWQVDFISVATGSQ